MIPIPAFSSRKDKEIFLIEIVKTLSINSSEKDIYTLCIEVLDNSSFEIFFNKILTQIEWNTQEEKEFTNIEPFTATLI